jgi:G patch domain-containing protein 1
MLEDEDAEEAKKHTYAPRDTPILLVDRKDNAHGLGYRAGMGLNDSLGVSKGTEGLKGPKLSCEFHE